MQGSANYVETDIMPYWLVREWSLSRGRAIQHVDGSGFAYDIVIGVPEKFRFKSCYGQYGGMHQRRLSGVDRPSVVSNPSLGDGVPPSALVHQSRPSYKQIHIRQIHND